MKGAKAEGGSAGHGAPGEWTDYPVCGPVRGGPEREAIWGGDGILTWSGEEDEERVGKGISDQREWIG